MNLELENFKAWLESRDKNEVVGRTFNCYFCPIATWIKDTTKEEVVIVGTEKIYSLSEQLVHPSWIKEFIEKIDKDREINRRSVTVEEALFTLSKIEN